MTVAEFFGCAFLAFGPPVAMFAFTIAPRDPMRIIILLIASFFWLVSLLLSSIIWFLVVPLRDKLIFGLVCSVLIQEAFRYLLYFTLRKTERVLQEVADNIRVTENKHVLAYASGLGFGIISGATFVNILADSVGPATMGLKAGSESFFITSAAHTLCFILLHTFWTIIFFNACDKRKNQHLAFVVLSHFFVSSVSLWNGIGFYTATLMVNYSMLVVCMIFAFRIAGGSLKTVVRFVKCQ